MDVSCRGFPTFLAEETRRYYMPTFNDVFDAAQGLPPNDRLRLMDALWDSFYPPNEWPQPSEEWIAESQRRSAAYDAGEMSASPWPEARARARKKAGLDG